MRYSSKVLSASSRSSFRINRSRRHHMASHVMRICKSCLRVRAHSPASTLSQRTADYTRHGRECPRVSVQTSRSHVHELAYTVRLHTYTRRPANIADTTHGRRSAICGRSMQISRSPFARGAGACENGSFDTCPDRNLARHEPQWAPEQWFAVCVCVVCVHVFFCARARAHIEHRLKRALCLSRARACCSYTRGNMLQHYMRCIVYVWGSGFLGAYMLMCMFVTATRARTERSIGMPSCRAVRAGALCY